MSRTTYERRKALGLCVTCGGERDRADRVECSKCREYGNKYKAQVRKMYKKYNICPKCGRNKLFGSFATCEECLEKQKVFQQTEDYKIKYAKYNKDARIRKRQAFIEKGMCLECGKRKARSNRTRCEVCTARVRRRYEQERLAQGKIPRSIRTELGLCYICGEKAIDNYRICCKCKERVTANLPQSNTNPYWMNDNKIVFGRN